MTKHLTRRPVFPGLAAWSALVAIPLATGCGPTPPPRGTDDAWSPDRIAESYVRLVLAAEEHEEIDVTTYYGPPDWREEARSNPRSLDQIADRAADLLERFPSPPPTVGEEDLETLRHTFLRAQIEALAARVDMLRGRSFSFDEESRALYDVVAPELEEETFTGILAELEARLEAEGFADGTLVERYEAFREDFILAPENIDKVFRAALEACRERTRKHIDLPAGESLELEYVTGETWRGSSSYEGNYRSVIQINVDLPVSVDRALDLACHEGYPGHHVHAVLLEKHLVRDRGWVEYQVLPMFSPLAFFAEGIARLSVELAFPGEERLEFEREVLFPLAGLDPERAASYHEISQLVDRLRPAAIVAARRFLDGEIDAAAAAEWLTRYAAMPADAAAKRIGSIELTRSYVVNYTLGLDAVRRYVDRYATSPDERWRVAERLLVMPRLPSSLEP